MAILTLLMFILAAVFFGIYMTGTTVGKVNALGLGLLFMALGHALPLLAALI